METQEAQLLIGQVAGQGGAEEQVEEVDDLAARHEYHDFILGRKLREQEVRSPWQRLRHAPPTGLRRSPW